MSTSCFAFHAGWQGRPFDPLGPRLIIQWRLCQYMCHWRCHRHVNAARQLVCGDQRCWGSVHITFCSWVACFAADYSIFYVSPIVLGRARGISLASCQPILGHKAQPRLGIFVNFSKAGNVYFRHLLIVKPLGPLIFLRLVVWKKGGLCDLSVIKQRRHDI